MIRVCMLIWQYWPVETGGSEMQCRKLSHELSKANVNCTVLTSRANKEYSSYENDNNVVIRRIPIFGNLFRQASTAKTSTGGGADQAVFRHSYMALLSFFATKLMRYVNALSFLIGSSVWLFVNRKDIDVIHMHGEWLASYGDWLGHFLNKPVICKVTDMPIISENKRGLPFQLKDQKLPSKLYFVVLHNGMAEEMLRTGVSRKMITIIPNGLVIPETQAVPSKGKYVICVANLDQGSRHKGFDILFKAWSLFCYQFSDVQLKVVGKGDPTVWVEHLEELKILRRVEFSGYVSSTDALYQQAALFVLASRHEGLPNTLLEAQAFGLPAVVSDIPGNRAVVLHDTTGKIVPVEDVKALAEAIAFYWNAPMLRDQVGKSAKKRIDSLFSIEHVCKKYIALYEEVLQGHAKEMQCVG